ncbi:hypothetical protein ACFOU2_14515 [Bacillus songklensis]|uniref:Uncharacterized protein n=1 Tax=Bacillus songklensis TaxID=1069116 RepID=A0ABV8B5N0_9BACI
MLEKLLKDQEIQFKEHSFHIEVLLINGHTFNFIMELEIPKSWLRNKNTMGLLRVKLSNYIICGEPIKFDHAFLATFNPFGEKGSNPAFFQYNDLKGQGKTVTFRRSEIASVCIES